ncbi:MAG: hypothetical protein QM756_12730 [Polyangiaceae bacterium]
MRFVSLDWKEHPTEVMLRLDELAGAAWRRDAARWEFADGLKLDKLRVEPFLAEAVPALAARGLTILRASDAGDVGDDDVRITVVASSKAAAAIGASKRKLTRVAAAKARPRAARAAKVRAKPTRREVATPEAVQSAIAALNAKYPGQHLRTANVPRHFEVGHVVRLMIAAGGTEDDVRHWLDAYVDSEIDFLGALDFRTHFDFQPEVLGAAMLQGRDAELVRALAHVFPLGSPKTFEAYKTKLFPLYVGRDESLGEARRIKALESLLTGPGPKSNTLKYLSGVWSTWSRGMAGSRVSFLATALSAKTQVKIPEGVAHFIASLAPRPERVAKDVLRVAPCPALPRLASGPHAERAAALAAWVRESLAYAKRERSGMFLRAVPELAIDVAVLIYAAQGGVDATSAWLDWAVDLDIRRCAARLREDTLALGPRSHGIAGAAVLVGKERALADAWRARPQSEDFRAWLMGKRASGELETTRALPRAVAKALASGGVQEFSGVLQKSGNPPWTLEPYDPFATALAKRAGASAPLVMTELARRPGRKLK